MGIFEAIVVKMHIKPSCKVPRGAGTGVLSCTATTVSLERNVCRPRCTFRKRSRNKVSNTGVVFFGGIDLRRCDLPVIHRYPYSR